MLKCTYFTWAEAVLLIVKFSASEANDVSKSPVSTFPVGFDCGFGCDVACPPVFDKLKPRTFPDWVAILPVVAVEAGFNTSPSASKPLIFCYLFWFWFYFNKRKQCRYGLRVLIGFTNVCVRVRVILIFPWLVFYCFP